MNWDTKTGRKKKLQCVIDIDYKAGEKIKQGQFKLTFACSETQDIFDI